MDWVATLVSTAAELDEFGLGIEIEADDWPDALAQALWAAGAAWQVVNVFPVLSAREQRGA